MLRIQKNLFPFKGIPYIISHRNCMSITDTVKNVEKEAAHKKLLTIGFITHMEKGFTRNESIDYFIERGVDVTINDNYALIMACKTGNLEAIKRLELAGGNIKSIEEKLLKIACAEGHLDVLKYLVYRSNASTSNALFNQPLIIACRNGHLDIVKFLVENGADVHMWGPNYCFQEATDKKVLEYLEKYNKSEKGSFSKDISSLAFFTGYFAVSSGTLIGLGLIGYSAGIIAADAIDYFHFKE